jgi:hypothetical protein
MSITTTLTNRLKRGNGMNERGNGMNVTLPPARPETVDPDTLGLMDNIVKTAKERDNLRETRSRLESDLAQARMQIEYLEKQLETVTAQRDFYMRHSTTIYTRLSDIDIMIRQSLEEAKHEAFKPPPAVSAGNGSSHHQDDLQ